MIKVYFASKLKHAAKWRNLCDFDSRIFAHARWLKHNTIGTPDTAENAAQFWLEDEEDVRHADAVIVYAEPGDHLRGALVEAGIAITRGIPVFVVGVHSDYGTWQYHPGVKRAADIEEAIVLAIAASKGEG